MRKSQADIVSAVIIIVITLSLLSTAYFWGLPLIQKRQDTAIAERVGSHFNQNNANSLPNRIEDVAKVGGETTFNLDVDGLWILDENQDTLQFTFLSRVSNIAANAGWISLTSGASCPPSTGTVGQDKLSVICARSDTVANNYNITYRIWYRTLNESGGDKAHRIDLLQHSASAPTSTGKNVRIFEGDIRQELIAGQTLIITEVKILLV